MRPLGLILLVVTVPALANAYVIVRKDGVRIEAKAPPEYRGGLAIITLSGGVRGSLPEAQVDRDATERANAAPAVTKPAQRESSPAKATPAERKSSFTDADLPARGPQSDAPPTMPEATYDPPPDSAESEWAARDHAGRHDEEGGRAPDGDVERAERRANELKEEFKVLHSEVMADRQVSSSEIEAEKRMEAEIREAERDAAEARKARP